mmetsp:Transcript_22700/g.58133  ORF Transcript_22700/g.58133 Transcript_22700/m.58133 type:complete len:388 (+) Transcript_22700:315-1478(+)
MLPTELAAVQRRADTSDPELLPGTSTHALTGLLYAPGPLFSDWPVTARLTYGDNPKLSIYQLHRYSGAMDVSDFFLVDCVVKMVRVGLGFGWSARPISVEKNDGGVLLRGRIESEHNKWWRELRRAQLEGQQHRSELLRRVTVTQPSRPIACTQATRSSSGATLRDHAERPAAPPIHSDERRHHTPASKAHDADAIPMHSELTRVAASIDQTCPKPLRCSHCSATHNRPEPLDEAECAGAPSLEDSAYSQHGDPWDDLDPASTPALARTRGTRSPVGLQVPSSHCRHRHCGSHANELRIYNSEPGPMLTSLAPSLIHPCRRSYDNPLYQTSDTGTSVERAELGAGIREEAACNRRGSLASASSDEGIDCSPEFWRRQQVWPWSLAER